MDSTQDSINFRQLIGREIQVGQGANTVFDLLWAGDFAFDGEGTGKVEGFEPQGQGLEKGDRATHDGEFHYRVALGTRAAM